VGTSVRAESESFGGGVTERATEVARDRMLSGTSGGLGLLTIAVETLESRKKLRKA
jgi:hypothetical protein